MLKWTPDVLSEFLFSFLRADSLLFGEITKSLILLDSKFLRVGSISYKKFSTCPACTLVQ